MMFGMEKNRTVWLPNGENFLKICLFVSTESTNVTDGQTDRRTDNARLHRPRLHSIARQNVAGSHFKRQLVAVRYIDG